MKVKILTAVLMVISGLIITVTVLNQARIDMQLKNQTQQSEVEQLNTELETKDNKIKELKNKNKSKSKTIDKQNKRIEKLSDDLQAKISNPTPEPQSAHTQPVASSCDDYRPLLEKYNWNVDTMLRIMQAESGCNPNNHNLGDNHGVCQGSYGLLQIGCVHGVTIADMSIPSKNIAKAFQIYSGQGYNAWSTY